MRKALLGGAIAATTLIPMAGYGEESPSAGRYDSQVQSAIEVARWVGIGSVVAIGYFVYGIPNPTEAGYLIVGAVGGFLASESYRDWRAAGSRAQRLPQ